MFKEASLIDNVFSASQNQVLKYILSGQYYLKIRPTTSCFDSEGFATPTLSSISSKTILMLTET
jgi:hypothetical protein